MSRRQAGAPVALLFPTQPRDQFSALTYLQIPPTRKTSVNGSSTRQREPSPLNSSSVARFIARRAHGRRGTARHNEQSGCSRFLHSTASKIVIATWFSVWQTALGRQRRLSSRTLERANPSKGALARGALRFFCRPLCQENARRLKAASHTQGGMPQMQLFLPLAGVC